MTFGQRRQYHRKWQRHECRREKNRGEIRAYFVHCREKKKNWQRTLMYFTICSIQVDLLLTSCMRPIHYFFPQQWLECFQQNCWCVYLSACLSVCLYVWMYECHFLAYVDSPLFTYLRFFLGLLIFRCLFVTILFFSARKPLAVYICEWSINNNSRELQMLPCTLESFFKWIVFACILWYMLIHHQQSH